MSAVAFPLRRRWGRFGLGPIVPALAYHKVAEIPSGAKYRSNYVTPRQFLAQLRLLRAAGFRSISFTEYLAYRRGEGPLPPRPILITFDDGYRSNQHFALPALRAAGFSATVFAVSGLLGDRNTWDGDELQEPLLSASDIRALLADGHDVQSHTRTHADLTRLAPACALQELETSRRELEQIKGGPVTVIAYPWGMTNPRVQQLAVDAGYEAGVILRRRVNFPTTPQLELRRIGVNSDTRISRLAWDLGRLRWRGA